MQLCVHLGAALSHSRGHVDVVLVRHLDAQLALPSLLGELLGDIGLFLRNGGQLDGQLTVQDMRHQQLLDAGGNEGDGALDGIFCLLLPLAVQAKREKVDMPDKPMVSDSILQCIFQFSPFYSRIIDEYKADLYISGAV